MEYKNQKLIYVNLLGVNSDRNYTYEFYFTDDPELAWGDHWEDKPASINNIEVPVIQVFDSMKILKTNLILNLSQKNSCFSMMDMKCGIIPVCWENIDEYEEFPEDGRIVFPFGIDIYDVEKKLAMRNLCFEDKEINKEFDF